MALNGAALKLVSTVTHASGHPGGSYQVTIRAQPIGTYPANGEPIADLIAAINALPESKVKVVAGVLPDNLWVSDGTGSLWQYSKNFNTIRNWAAIGAGKAEHATDVYDAVELAGILTITMFFPLMGSTSR